MAATKARSSVRNYGAKLLIEQDMLRKYQGRQAREEERADRRKSLKASQSQRDIKAASALHY